MDLGLLSRLIMRLTTNRAGSIQQDMAQDLLRIKRAVTSGTHVAGQGLKDELRRQVISAGLGTRLAYSWRNRSYTNQGTDAAALVWSKAPKIMRVFDRGAVIRGKNGLWLAIPTPAAPKRGTDGKRVHPGNFPEGRYGPLRFVYRKGKPSLLVVDGVRISAKTGRVGRRAKGGSYTKSGRIKSGITTVVMFVMVPQVRIPKKLDVARATNRWLARLPTLIDQKMGRRNS
ncbi:DUF6441 family protein [Magnetococcus sp. PR-3]|uniref:DUF6441 family protein n=1 Tax=Magnetococcus sp. PR-3 TaxID=3120355 RepID=UPI002FCDFD98